MKLISSGRKKIREHEIKEEMFNGLVWVCECEAKMEFRTKDFHLRKSYSLNPFKRHEPPLASISIDYHGDEMYIDTTCPFCLREKTITISADNFPPDKSLTYY